VEGAEGEGEGVEGVCFWGGMRGGGGLISVGISVGEFRPFNSVQILCICKYRAGYSPMSCYRNYFLPKE
jgi:hypothetical protein